MKGDVLPHEVVAEAVPEVPDAVHGGGEVCAGRVNSQAYRRHPSGNKDHINFNIIVSIYLLALKNMYLLVMFSFDSISIFNSAEKRM